MAGFDVRVRENVLMEARDGTVLRADVYSPVSGGGYPVLLQRTPYDKAFESNAATARDLAARGYIVAVQDIRGRYASEGDFIWQFQDSADTFDARDGYDAVEWAATLPGSDGQVGTWGHSYPSWCIWQLAGAAPPHLGALFASGMASRILDLNFGVFETGRRLQWTYNMAVDARRRAGDDRGPSTRAEADLQWHEVERGKWIWRLPLADIPDHVFATLGPMLKRYMREQNKGVDTGVGSEPPVKLFVMNENRWRYEEQWPPAGAGEIELFLHSGGLRANSVGGDGVLSTSEPSEERPDRYDYDPSDPVMSLMDLGAQAAVRDQSPLDAREDILVYATPPLDRPVTVIGPVTLRLWVASSAPQTDFTAKLIDVRPDGLAVNVSYGIMRTSYMEGYDKRKPMEPETPYELTIRLGPTGIRFGEGHRIRLDVASSDFPNFDRNHNTGADFWSDSELRVARQTVFHDRERPSRLLLSVV